MLNDGDFIRKSTFRLKQKPVQPSAGIAQLTPNSTVKGED
jgi:hypothetical protein